MKYFNPKKLRLLFTISFVFSFLIVSAQQNGKIKGTITTSDGELAAGVNVILKNSKYWTVSDENGNFEFNRVKPSTYTLQVSLTGYETSESEVIVAESETSNINLQLKVSNKELKEVVVNGKKSILSKKTDYVARMPLTNIENPQVYSVIQKELLLQQVAVDIKGAVMNAPGVVSISYPSGGVGMIFRGFSIGVNARNGMETVSGRSSVDLGNVERIEILKGPSGTLFGSSVSSFGGVVNLVTKKPFETSAAEVSYTTGSYNLNRLTVDVNTPLNQEKTVLFRINMGVHREKSFLDYGFNNTLLFAPSLTYKASDKLTFNFDAELYNVNNTRRTYNTYDANSGITNPSQLQIDYKKSMFHDDNDAKSTATKFFGQAEYQISENWKSTTVFSFVGEDVERSYQSYAVWSSPTQVARRVGLWGPIFNNYTNIQENINGQFSTGSIKHKFLAGVNYRLYTSNFSGGSTFTLDNIDITTPFAPIRRKAVDAGLNLTTSAVADQKTISAYACDVVNFTDKFSAMLSLRLDNFERAKVGTVEGYSQTALSPKFGLVYEFVKDQVAVFTNYMNGFQNMAPVTQPDQTLLVLDPIYAVQYEGGLKAETSNKKLSGSISYYNITIDNATRVDAGYTIQDGKQVSKGVDFELMATPFNGLSIVSGYAYNDNRIVRASDPSIEGKKATSSPENVVNFWTTYTFQNKLKGLGIGAGANYIDKNYFTANNLVYMPSYTVYNATVYYEKPTWRLGLKFNNITNEKYWDFWGSSMAPANLLANLTIKF
ncbi:TonB-dependent receptor [Flavobacterium quisquiliarum]|uniref:TonB-dependent siderophore receptor n=1 Tax=Flavobacterium quisquiliarum TaxID=1834436 RepID=A0ABV8W622_9FLAO|nr:TonB-dependent receptor [Flavobacterium quisquiliarum]MBW1656500.1 TonB-dependent siderophore receptor [Flavobacterium quisquiliarum]NWL03831.1 TonB-dependent siderophore receptor [Flavobacterium collinsii]